MIALEILHILHLYQEYLIQFIQSEAERQPQCEWDHSVSLSYTSITMKIFRITEDDTDRDLYIQIMFRIENNQILFSDIYHPGKNDIQQLIEEIKANTKLHAISFNASQVQPIDLTDEVTNYLSIADRISAHAVNIYAGDSYWPGNYSNVKLTPNRIVLEQVNHMNSRSLNHKDDYSLRDLKFKIPIQNEHDLKHSYDDAFIGNMLVSFSDRSSQNKREACDAIKEQISKEIINYLNF